RRFRQSVRARLHHRPRGKRRRLRSGDHLPGGSSLRERGDRERGETSPGPRRGGDHGKVLTVASNSHDHTEAMARPSRPPLPVILRAINCASHPAALSLREGSVTVGAGSQADLVIDHKTVSRAHLEMSLVQEGVRIRDLDSRNGTFYLGQRVEAATVQPGTRLLLGSAELSIEPDFDESSVPPSRDPGYAGLIGSSP